MCVCVSVGTVIRVYLCGWRCVRMCVLPKSDMCVYVFMLVCGTGESDMFLCLLASDYGREQGLCVQPLNPPPPRPEVGESNLIENHGKCIVIVVAIL